MARILLLDFDRDSLAMMKRFLELSGHEVKGFREPGQLHESLANGPFDLAVIDIAADCSNVNSLLELLDDVLGALKTIIITDSNADECMHDRPGLEFIFRPVDLEVLEARVKRMLEQGIHNHG